MLAASFVAHFGINTEIDFPSLATLTSSFASEIVTWPTPERAAPVNETQTASCWVTVALWLLSKVGLVVSLSSFGTLRV